MTHERVVIDTNVLISSLFFTTSTPARAVDEAVTKAQLVATTETLRELIGKLHHDVGRLPGSRNLATVRTICRHLASALAQSRSCRQASLARVPIRSPATALWGFSNTSMNFESASSGRALQSQPAW